MDLANSELVPWAGNDEQKVEHERAVEIAALHEAEVNAHVASGNGEQKDEEESAI